MDTSMVLVLRHRKTEDCFIYPNYQLCIKTTLRNSLVKLEKLRFESQFFHILVTLTQFPTYVRFCYPINKVS